jgi:hypothetical protein
VASLINFLFQKMVKKIIKNLKKILVFFHFLKKIKLPSRENFPPQKKKKKKKKKTLVLGDFECKNELDFHQECESSAQEGRYLRQYKGKNKIKSEFYKTLALPLTSQKFYTHAKLLAGQANKLWLALGRVK